MKIQILVLLTQQVPQGGLRKEVVAPGPQDPDVCGGVENSFLELLREVRLYGLDCTL